MCRQVTLKSFDDPLPPAFCLKPGLGPGSAGQGVPTGAPPKTPGVSLHLQAGGRLVAAKIPLPKRKCLLRKHREVSCTLHLLPSHVDKGFEGVWGILWWLLLWFAGGLGPWKEGQFLAPCPRGCDGPQM